MGWIDRIIDALPDMSKEGKFLALLGGTVAMGVGMMLGITPLAVGGMLVGLAGGIANAVPEKSKPRQPKSPEQQAAEDAAVDAALAAWEREMEVPESEARESWVVFVASEEPPVAGRVH